LAVIPFGTIGTAAKLEYFSSLGVTEAVLRIPAGPAADMDAALDELADLVTLGASLPDPVGRPHPADTRLT
jgi:hypothetical protein